MRILIAIVVMGCLGTFATLLTMVQLLARTWPLLTVALATVVVVRLRERRNQRAAAVPRRPGTAITSLPEATAWASRPSHAGPLGWVVVPVWGDPRTGPHGHAHRVIDGHGMTRGEPQ